MAHGPVAAIDDTAPVRLLHVLKELPVLAIVRGAPADNLRDVGRALVEGGLRVIEVTLDSPNALGVVERWRSDFAGVALVGVGTVLDVVDARRAVDAGAQFLVSPHTDLAVARYAASVAVDYLPGGLTPTEAVTAWKAGAAAVKVFPVGPAGGVAYLRSLSVPLRDIPLIPVGGVRVEDVGDYLAAGAAAV